METIYFKNLNRLIRKSEVLLTALLFASMLKPAKICAQTQNGQIGFSVYSSGYYTVSDYAGFSSGNSTHTFHIQLSGTYINISNWSIKARVNGAILPLDGAQNVGGIPFPENKIKMQLSADNNTSPTLGEIGVPLTSMPLTSGGEITLIPNSAAPLFLQSPDNSHKNIEYYFQIHIEGGAYLDQLRNRQQWKIIKYNVPITFTLYNGAGAPIGSRSVTYTIQLEYTFTGTPPPTAPTYSIEVMGDARDGSLNFNTLSSYINGTSVTYSNGLKVTSSTAFEVTVKSRFTHFSNPTGDLLPIDILRLQLTPGSQAPTNAQYNTINVSTQPQQIMRSQSGRNESMFMNIIYSAAGNDERLIQAKSGKYSTSIVYELLPR
jgi:hypothetical protein